LNTWKINAVGILALTFIFLFAGCTSVPNGTVQSTANEETETSMVDQLMGSPWGLTPKLIETIGKFIVPEIQNWNEGEVSVYYIDVPRFNEFKNELDKGGEYRLNADIWSEKNRDWWRDQSFVRLAVLPDGRLYLDTYRSNNTAIRYNYTKLTPVAIGVKLQESLRKYIVPIQQDWGERDGIAFVYFIDLNRFNEFKAELDKVGDYYVGGTNRGNRDWDQGRTYARLAVRYSGKLELWLCNSDNSYVYYTYYKYPQAGEPKIIKIIGFPVNLMKTGRQFYIGIAGNGEGATTTVFTSDDQGITTGEFMLSNASGQRTQDRWTGTGLYYIGIETALPKNPSGTLAFYNYSANGTSKTLVEIKDTVTVLKWEDFLWARDY